MLHLVFTKHYILVSLLNISDRYPFAYFDLNMKLKLSAVPVNLNNVNPLTLGLATLFHIPVKIRERAAFTNIQWKTLNFSV